MEEYNIVQIFVNIIIVMILVGLNGFFVAVEFSLVKIRPSRLIQLKNEGVWQAKYVKDVVDNLDEYLSACQLGITLASIGLGWAGEPTIAKMLMPIFEYFHISEALMHTISFIIAFAVVTILHIVLGELAPKSLAIQRTEKVALLLAVPLMLFYKVTYPATYMLNKMSGFVLFLLRLDSSKEAKIAHSEEEIKILIGQSHKEGLIDKVEKNLVDKVFNFTDKVAREAMIHRTNAIILYTQDSYEKNLEKIINTRHTRYPIATGDKDNVVGFIHVSDFYAETSKNKSVNIKDISREILTIPEFMDLDDVLRIMQKASNQIAVVIDEFGGTAGIITLEDIIEEIVGEIHDEFDIDKKEIIKLDNNRYSFDGRVLVEDINELLGLNICDEDVDTIGGWFHMHLETDDIKIGMKYNYDKYQFEVKELNKNRISRIVVSKV